jgi:Asp-tRNA(Asn)/Glu-tRNA(Gln) amidotransferase A subunit family amidase
MNSSDFKPAFATAAETANAVRSKRISASDLTKLTFERIDRQNPQLNAIVWQDRDQAMARAQQPDEALASGKASGALHGVPVTIKESFAYQGSPNTWGVPGLKAANSPRTAVAVERLESAGAIVVGKTNVPVMLGDWQSYNPIYGTTNNPWDLATTCSFSPPRSRRRSPTTTARSKTVSSTPQKADDPTCATWRPGSASRRWQDCLPRWRRSGAPAPVCR